MVNGYILFTLIISIGIILIFYYYEIHPYLYNKITRKYNMLSKNISNETYKKKVLLCALKYSKHEVPKMSLADNTFFPVVFIRELSLSIKGNNRLKNSFPRAFLLNGVIDYAISKDDKKAISLIEKKILSFANDVIKNTNNIKFVDQVSMGMSAIKLYQITKKPVYKDLCDTLITFLTDSIDSKHNIILYRKDKDFHFVDVLGMICPFLLMYAQEFENEDFIEISNNQLEFYITHGLSSSHFPFHALELSNKTPLGSSNWGRGIGWYMLALSATLKYTNNKNNKKYDYFRNEMNILVSNLEKFRQNHYWGQFLGISKKWNIDTSSACMIIYSIKLSGYEINLNNFYEFLKPLTRKNGAVDFTSGDTEDINLYSREYGISELTQGILLSIFNTETKK